MTSQIERAQTAMQRAQRQSAAIKECIDILMGLEDFDMARNAVDYIKARFDDANRQKVQGL